VNPLPNAAQISRSKGGGPCLSLFPHHNVAVLQYQKAKRGDFFLSRSGAEIGKRGFQSSHTMRKLILWFRNRFISSRVSLLYTSMQLET
jgi:hypothetical protein